MPARALFQSGTVPLRQRKRITSFPKALGATTYILSRANTLAFFETIRGDLFGGKPGKGSTGKQSCSLTRPENSTIRIYGRVKSLKPRQTVERSSVCEEWIPPQDVLMSSGIYPRTSAESLALSTTTTTANSMMTDRVTTFLQLEQRCRCCPPRTS